MDLDLDLDLNRTPEYEPVTDRGGRLRGLDPLQARTGTLILEVEDEK